MKFVPVLDDVVEIQLLLMCRFVVGVGELSLHHGKVSDPPRVPLHTVQEGERGSLENLPRRRRLRFFMARKLTKIEKERLKCACFYVLLCVLIGLLIAWNFMSGEANVFVKMFDFNGD